MDEAEVQKQKVILLTEQLWEILSGKYTASEACLAMSTVMKVLIDDKELDFSRELREIIELTLNISVCDCRSIGKQGMSCDDTLWFCKKCAPDRFNDEV